MDECDPVCFSLHPETCLDPPHMNLQWALPLLINVYNIYVPHDRAWILEPCLTRLWLFPAEFHWWPHKSDGQQSNEIGTETISHERTNPWRASFLINESFWRLTGWLLGPNVMLHPPLQPRFRREHWSPLDEKHDTRRRDNVGFISATLTYFPCQLSLLTLLELH